MAHTLGNGRVDGDFCDVAKHPEVIVVRAVFWQFAARGFHRVGGLHHPQPVLSDPAHGLGVAGKHRDHAHILQHVLGSDGFRAHPAFCERHVGWHVGVEVVAHHDHVEQLCLAVDAIGQGRVGRTRQHVELAGHADNVRGVATTRTFGVEGVNGAAFKGINGVFDVAAFVQAVGVDRDLHVHFIGNAQRVAQGVGGGAPVFMDLEARDPGNDLLGQRGVGIRVAFAQQTDVDRQALNSPQHLADVPRAGGYGGTVGAVRGANAAAEEGGDAIGKAVISLLR